MSVRLGCQMRRRVIVVMKSGTALGASCGVSRMRPVVMVTMMPWAARGAWLVPLDLHVFCRGERGGQQQVRKRGRQRRNLYISFQEQKLEIGPVHLRGTPRNSNKGTTRQSPAWSCMANPTPNVTNPYTTRSVIHTTSLYAHPPELTGRLGLASSCRFGSGGDGGNSGCLGPEPDRLCRLSELRFGFGPPSRSSTLICWPSLSGEGATTGTDEGAAATTAAPSSVPASCPVFPGGCFWVPKIESARKPGIMAAHFSDTSAPCLRPHTLQHGPRHKARQSRFKTGAPVARMRARAAERPLHQRIVASAPV